LIIRSHNYYESEEPVELSKHLPKLKELQILHDRMEGITLTPETTPELRRFETENLGDSCHTVVTCPFLEGIRIHFLHPDDDKWVYDMVKKFEELTSL